MNAIVSRVGIALLVALGGVALGGGGGCNIGQEGERCNPSLTHDECGAGLACTNPTNCPEYYCCPTSGKSSNPYCQDGCNGGNVSICASGGDADCPSEGGDDGGSE
jgi:hypothetical protein